jgi:predicted permease
VELSNFLVLILSFLGLALLGWFFWLGFKRFCKRSATIRRFCLCSGMIDQPRVQLSQVLDNSTQLIQ